MLTSIVRGKNMAYNTAGRGGPSVILEAGLGAESADWAEVESAVGSFATVFRYDRLGRGASDAPTEARDAIAMVSDLRALLSAADVAPPYLLVGHSFGGLLMQVFAQHHRAEVSGLVLAESMHPDQFEVLGPAIPPPRPDDAPPLAGMRRFWTEGWQSQDATPERIDLPRALGQAPRAGLLDHLPLRVLTAGSFLHVPFLPVEAREALQSRWVGLQAQLLALSSAALQTSWPSSGHFVQRENPHAITAAIRDLVG